MFLYPLCNKYSYLLNYPKNIKPDWLLGIKETFEFIIENFHEDSKLKTFSFNFDKVEYRNVFQEVSKQVLIDLYSKTFLEKRNPSK